jgi:hypothetical protein
MSTFHVLFWAMSIAERQRIAREAGLSLPYLYKHTYVSNRDPKFHLCNAVALDKASGGRLPLYDLTAGDVDWRHVLRRLQSAKRKGLI